MMRDAASGSTAEPAVIDIDRVFKSFAIDRDDDFVALRDVALQIRDRQFVSFVGPSGCGKSTLMNMIAGLVEPDSGRVLYRGEPVKGPNWRTGYITQRDHLLPWRTLEDNVALALEIRHVPHRERMARVHDILDRVGLHGFAKLYPSQLSGGMRKRASIAQTLIYQPETLLMDEPFGAVDAFLRASLHDMLMSLCEREKVTVVFVTHDLDEAILLSDTVVVFGKSPGRIVHCEPIPFPRPRRLLQLRTEPAFGAIWSKLWRHVGEGQTLAADGGATQHDDVSASDRQADV